MTVKETNINIEGLFVKSNCFYDLKFFFLNERSFITKYHF